jgi:hypothetical protein
LIVLLDFLGETPDAPEANRLEVSLHECFLTLQEKIQSMAPDFSAVVDEF